MLGNSPLLKKKASIAPIRFHRASSEFCVKQARRAEFASLRNKLLSRNTSAHVATSMALQAVTLAGMSGNQTAFYGSIDDVLENIKPSVLEENSKFVLELLKSM